MELVTPMYGAHIETVLIVKIFGVAGFDSIIHIWGIEINRGLRGYWADGTLTGGWRYTSTRLKNARFVK